MAIETHRFEDDGAIPNSPLPVLVYHDEVDAHDPASCEGLFGRNGWLGAWRDGIYPFHHFHSTAHEVLGIVAGRAAVVLGGPSGCRFEVGPGDVLVLPAGTGHCNAGSSGDLLVIGAYPDGVDWDIRRGDPAEHDEVLANIGAVPLPGADPVHGPGGPLDQLWRAQDLTGALAHLTDSCSLAREPGGYTGRANACEARTRPSMTSSSASSRGA